MTRNVLSAGQTAKRLGVKVQTVYAYVSRGALSRTFADDGRTSQFDAVEVDGLARRGRPRSGTTRVGSVDVSLGTSVTEIRATELCYRKHDAVQLAREHTFESVAELLWTSTLTSDTRWSELADPLPIVRKLTTLLPMDSPAIERFAAVTASLACEHPARADLSHAGVVQLARRLITAFVHALPVSNAAATRSRRPASLAWALWPRLSTLPATAARARVLDSALILLADHELATSTFAARVAASTRADPFTAVLAGLGALSGPLHGKAASKLHRLLRNAASDAEPERGALHAISDTGTLVGFGHPVYRGGDPRASELLAMLRPLVKAPALRVIDAVLAAGKQRGQAEPNVDFALGALTFALDMPAGSSEAIFAIARTAGFIAHTLEEYGEQPLRFRARAIYTG